MTPIERQKQAILAGQARLAAFKESRRKLSALTDGSTEQPATSETVRLDGDA